MILGGGAENLENPSGHRLVIVEAGLKGEQLETHDPATLHELGDVVREQMLFFKEVIDPDLTVVDVVTASTLNEHRLFGHPVIAVVVVDVVGVAEEATVVAVVFELGYVLSGSHFISVLGVSQLYHSRGRITCCCGRWC